MSDQKSFFYLKDITRLIQEATNVGGEELGIVIYPSATKDDKPKLKVSYLKPSVTRTLDAALNGEKLTGAIEGCPYPPRCE